MDSITQLFKVLYFYFTIYALIIIPLAECKRQGKEFPGFSTGTIPYFGPTTSLYENIQPPDDSASSTGTDYVPIDYSSRVNPETRLIGELFSQYNGVARPVLNMSQAVEVKFGFRLLSIQLNEVDQLLTSFVWLPHQWIDERLTWDPENYENLTKLIIPNKMLWLPDTFLYQSSADTGYVMSHDRVPLMSTGSIEWWPSATLLSPCTIDVTYFPFDNQNCKLTIGPWSYHSEQVNFTLMEEEANLEGYSVSGAWQLTKVEIERELVRYETLNMSYTLINLTIRLKRKALYYWLNVIIPCLLLNSLGIGLFILPADSGEKVGFGLGILLTVFVFAIIVNENIPQTSDYTPIIGIYLVLVMCMISFSLFLAIIIVNLHHRRPKLGPAPDWMKKLFLKKVPALLGIHLPKLPLFTGFTMQGITPKKKKKMKMMKRLRKEREEEAAKKKANGVTKPLVREVEHDGDVLDASISVEMNIENEEPSGGSQQATENEPEPTEQSEYERLAEAYKSMPFDEKNNDEWILIALVWDRIACWAFLALLVLSSSMVLIIVPSAQNVGMWDD